MTTPIHGALPPPKQIRFVNNQGQPPSKRRRINAACLTCRKRKTRCAGEKPDCSTCKKNGHVCLGYTDIVERRRDDRRDAAFLILKTEPAEPHTLSNGTLDDCLEDDDELEHRRWGSKPAPLPAGFVEDVVSGSDSRSSTTVTPGRPSEASDDWNQDTKSQGSTNATRRSNAPRNVSYSEDSRSSNNRSPVHLERHRVPYFRYFGPTAIVPGFKQMVVAVYRDSRRKSRSNSFSTASPGSLLSHGNSRSNTSHHETALETLEDLPVYDVNSSGPVHPLIVELVETFFTYLGSNYHFLRKGRFLSMLKEKRIEPILVDAVCALAARFSDRPVFRNQHDGKMKRSEYGHVFARRAKSAIVDTFPCPSVAAVQACLLIAYEGFGADQDSALWMYLGIAIRMAVDLGLQKMEGVKYQGERDPWYTRYWSRKSTDEDGPDSKDNDEEALSRDEQKEVEQERIDTFWAIFVLDRVISSGTGRPVTFRDDDYELSLPPQAFDPLTKCPAPFPPFIELIHLYGRASDVLNNIRNANDLTEEKMNQLKIMERDLTAIYQKQHSRLHFNAVNFQEQVSANQGTTFILLHFWFHALVIILHQPTLLTPFHSLRPAQLLANSPELGNSRELSMSSAKTIADILAFAELIDPKSLIGNPFTSQPIYIAACAFLMESVANTSQPPSPKASPTPDVKPADHFKSHVGRYNSNHDPRPVKHSLLASAANQNYQRCYKSLEQLEQYWGGVRYILHALDQKSKGIWDCETFTTEEYEAMMLARRGPLSRLSRFEHPSSPNVPPIAYSLTGTTNSPNSNLTVLFQGSVSAQPGAPTASTTSLPPHPQLSSAPTSAPTPPGNMVYDPIRQSLPQTPSPFPPGYVRPNFSAVRFEPHPSKAHRLSQSPAMSKSMMKYESRSPGDMDQSPHHDTKSHLYGMSRSNHGPLHHSYSYPAQQNHSPYGSVNHDRSSSSTPIDSGVGQQHHHSSHNNQSHIHAHDHHRDSDMEHHLHQQQHHNHHHQHHTQNENNSNNNPDDGGDYEGEAGADFAQSGLVSGSYSYMATAGLPINSNPINNDTITFNSQEVNFDMLGLHSEMMPPWLEILPGDVLGELFEGGMVGVGVGAGEHMG
ncbi:hypothetical protein N657DRAFT_329818 [Parathielavia appendiculata]|uniref:Zn(2)-C6 fungal-type domain-containing protein n=1 Tax=Parathielavia appendiculata TaxID=2587402 RepID=A0AAN6TR27_9PEZI|nr:hypothetical protein N657DRAFT_329818 [Parathielavia appendiculata]